MYNQTGIGKSVRTDSSWKVLFPILSFLFILIALSLQTSFVKEFDAVFTKLIQAEMSPEKTLWMEFSTFFGSSMWIFPAGLLLATLLALLGMQRLSGFLLVTLTAGRAVNWLLKELFHRDRPQYNPMITESGFSFPSGHSMNVIVFSLAVAIILVKCLEPSISLWISIVLLISMVLVVGASRIYLGVHFPSDVIAGFLAGAALVSACGWLFFQRDYNNATD